MNKVLYFFDQADANAIVFEDLDRYDVTLTFEKLREINDLAYSRTKQGLRPGKKPLRFFCLIQDDVFTTADRQLAMAIYKTSIPATSTCSSIAGATFLRCSKKRTLIEHFRTQIDTSLKELRENLTAFEQEHLKI